jgi:glycerol kinase
VELAPEEVWRALLAATRAVLARVDTDTLGGLGITDAHDTLTLWDRETLGAPRPALAPTDTRAGSARTDHRLTWLAAHEPRTWARVETGEYAVGGLASYLVARLTRGTWHVSDVAAAARTGLLDVRTGGWSVDRCAAAGVPLDALPELVASWGVVDRTDGRSFCGLDLPITGLAAAGAARLLARGGPAAAHGAGEPVPVWRAPDGRLTYAPRGTVEAGTRPGPPAARGAAYLAGLGTGVWGSPDELPASPQS